MSSQSFRSVAWILLTVTGISLPVGADSSAGRDIHGRITGQAAPLDGLVDFRDAVVFFRPVSGATAPLQPTEVVMRMEDKAFNPAVVAVVAGSVVRFPNSDPILHNAFSTSTSTAFDLGFYGAGEERAVTFAEAGLVRVYCNVHHSMAAYVMALDTPYFTRPDATGRFSLRIPGDAEGTLYIWHPQARVERISISPATEPDAISSALQVSLAFNGRRVPRHLNKHGKPYRKRLRPGY